MQLSKKYNFMKALNESINFDEDENEDEELFTTNVKDQYFTPYIEKLCNPKERDNITKEDIINLHGYVPKNFNELDVMVAYTIMFFGEKCDLNWIDTSKITTMHALFIFSHFKGDISEWDVSNVTDMSQMFKFSSFNGDISKWNMKNVRNIDEMFTCSAYNQDLSMHHFILELPAKLQYASHYYYGEDGHINYLMKCVFDDSKSKMYMSNNMDKWPHIKFIQEFNDMNESIDFNDDDNDDDITSNIIDNVDIAYYRYGLKYILVFLKYINIQVSNVEHITIESLYKNMGPNTNLENTDSDKFEYTVLNMINEYIQYINKNNTNIDDITYQKYRNDFNTGIIKYAKDNKYLFNLREYGIEDPIFIDNNTCMFRLYYLAGEHYHNTIICIAECKNKDIIIYPFYLAPPPLDEITDNDIKNNINQQLTVIGWLSLYNLNDLQIVYKIVPFNFYVYDDKISNESVIYNLLYYYNDMNNDNYSIILPENIKNTTHAIIADETSTYNKLNALCNNKNIFNKFRDNIINASDYVHTIRSINVPGYTKYNDFAGEITFNVNSTTLLKRIKQQ